MIKEIKRAQELLIKYNLKLWILLNKDGGNKIFRTLISKDVETLSFAFISANKVYILVQENQRERIDESLLQDEMIHVVTYLKEEQISMKIEDIVSELRFISNISLSYSTINDSDTDLIGHGEYVMITDMIKRAYIRYRKRVYFTSAEQVIYELICARTEKQRERITSIACITEEILDTTFKTIKTGMSEIEIAEHVIKLTKRITKDKLGKDIKSFSLAWDICPIVLTGPNLIKSGHTPPSDKLFLKGDTIYFDFGLKATYSDQEEIYTDMQRMGYALKKNQQKAPKNVMKVFTTLVYAIESVLDEMKPGTKGYEIDERVRQIIEDEGYQSYHHATGHPVGLKVHDCGCIIATKAIKRSSLSLVENGIYTLEPRIAVMNGGSIEEMFLVTKFGAVPICKTQKELYLI